MPTADPAGTVATRSAGLAEVRATLRWDRPPDAPESVLGAWPPPALSDTVRCDLAEAPLEDAAARGVSGTLRAMTEGGLGSALEGLMRALAAAAALSDAVLECRAARLAPPRSTPPDVLEALAFDLWEAGFCVRFAPSWTATPAGTVPLGVGGAEAGLRDFLNGHPSWSAAVPGNDLA